MLPPGRLWPPKPGTWRPVQWPSETRQQHLTAPASRVAYNFSESWAAAVEHYADLGRLIPASGDPQMW